MMGRALLMVGAFATLALIATGVVGYTGRSIRRPWIGTWCSAWAPLVRCCFPFLDHVLPDRHRRDQGSGGRDTFRRSGSRRPRRTAPIRG